jgi:hypothetical protein
MSQYPSPYSPPPYPQNAGYSYPQPNALAPARRASTLMLVLGGLILLLGLLNTLTAAVTPADMMLQREKTIMPASNEFTLSPALYRSMALVIGVATLITGIVFVGLALKVRRGSKNSTIAAIVVTSLLLLLMGLMTLTFIVAGLGAPAILPLTCLPGGGLALMIWQLIWLIGAARGTTSLWAAQQQFQMQYWQQYQQAMQFPTGYGYAVSAPPPPPPSAPPDAPSQAQ